ARANEAPKPELAPVTRAVLSGIPRKLGPGQQSSTARFAAARARSAALTRRGGGRRCRPGGLRRRGPALGLRTLHRLRRLWWLGRPRGGWVLRPGPRGGARVVSA